MVARNEKTLHGNQERNEDRKYYALSEMLPVCLNHVTPRCTQESLYEEHRMEAHLDSDCTNIQIFTLRQQRTKYEMKHHTGEVKAASSVEAC